MSSEIPTIYRIRSREPRSDEFGLQLLFLDDEDDDENHSWCTESVSVFGLIFHLTIPPDKLSLFAHRVWSGSKLLAYFIARNRHYVEHKRTIEFGAGTGLPSLMALACQSRYSILTDYPDDDVIQSIRETVGLNWDVCRDPRNRVSVVGHKWGSSVESIQGAVRQLRATSADNHEDHVSTEFDAIFLSECLWMHRSHSDLAKSLSRLLHPDGYALVTYSHHVPGCEAADDAFFSFCEEHYDIGTIHEESQEMEYMWNPEKSLRVYLRVLSRRGGLQSKVR